jgi:polyhydroxyalkanoate synthase subunit PhaC
VPLLSGAAEVRFEIVPGGHLGMLTGRAARGSTWRVLDEWIGQWSTTEAAATAKKPARKKPATKKTATKSAARKTAAKKTATKKSASRKPSPDPDAIGVNPTRRYGSASSRSLAR